MALTFPANPANGQIYDQYVYDATAQSWRVYGSDTGITNVLATKANLSGGNAFSGSQIITSGSFQIPNQVSFQATKTDAHATTSQYLVFNNVLHNTGNAYNSSNGRFTAPVSGRYLINFSTLLYSMGSASNVYLFVNAVQQQFMGTYGQFTGSYAGQGASAVINLNVNDYVQLYFTHNGTNLHLSYTVASGYFLG
jgi:hypothetical protein